jgi:hypothetical protein
MCLSPLQKVIHWPEELPPDSKYKADLFTIDPKKKEEFLSWVAGKMCLPRASPSLLQTRETSVSVKTDDVQGSFLELFREFANDNELDWGLTLNEIPISVYNARELVKHHRDILALMRTAEDISKFLYDDELII